MIEQLNQPWENKKLKIKGQKVKLPQKIEEKKREKLSLSHFSFPMSPPYLPIIASSHLLFQVVDSFAMHIYILPCTSLKEAY